MFQRKIGQLTLGDHITEISSKLELKRIAEPCCAGLIWPQPGLEPLLTWLQALPEALLPKGRVETKLAQFRFELEAMCDTAGLSPCDERDRLVEELVQMAEAFASAMRVDRLRLRMDVVRGDACRKFHMDALTARLICTLRGPGTELSLADATGQCDAVLQSLDAGDALVLRGTAWPTSPASPLRHRSPPIAGTGVSRLVLVLDPVAV